MPKIEIFKDYDGSWVELWVDGAKIEYEELELKAIISYRTGTAKD